MSSARRDVAERMALMSLAIQAQLQAGSIGQAEKPKTAYIHQQGGLFVHKPERNTQYTGARVANVQRNMPHR